MDNSIPKGPVRYIQPELTNEKQERDLSVDFGVNIDLQLLLAWAYGFMDGEATTVTLYLQRLLSASEILRFKILFNTSF